MNENELDDAMMVVGMIEVHVFNTKAYPLMQTMVGFMQMIIQPTMTLARNNEWWMTNKWTSSSEQQGIVGTYINEILSFATNHYVISMQLNVYNIDMCHKNHGLN